MFNLGCTTSTLTSTFRVLAIISFCTTVVFVFSCVHLYEDKSFNDARGDSVPYNHGDDANRDIADTYYTTTLDPEAGVVPGASLNAFLVRPRVITMVVLGFEFYWARDTRKEERDVICPTLNVTVKLTFSSDHRVIYHADITFFSHLYRLGKMRVWRDHLDRRRPNQRWVLFSLEPPIRSAKNTTVPSGWRYRTYHWTATYNAESDVPFLYGNFVKQEVPSLRNVSSDIYRTKTKLAVFLSSNCDMTKWPRLRFVQTMQKYMPVDLFGKCGTIPCDWNLGCTEQLKQYKFFFALENSQCEGYISEKFWHTLSRYQSVPVVWGARPRDYELVAPNNSYIHVSHFKSMRNLAEFITSLGSDEESYNAYHSWRQTGHVELLPDWSTLPADDHVCAAARRYRTDMELLAHEKRTTFRDVNGKDWLESCKVGRDKVDKRLPIPETGVGFVRNRWKN